jgi:hypothetical protein
MGGERKPGSNLGRPLVDWEPAFLFYAAQPPERRSYRVVADEFGASVRTVERHGRDERWQERARQLDREAAAAAAERLRETRTAKLEDYARLCEATEISYATQLSEGKVPIRPADLARLFKLRSELWEASETASAEPAAPAAPTQGESLEHRRRVLQALQRAGALDRLLRDEQVHVDDGQHRDGDDDHRRDDGRRGAEEQHDVADERGGDGDGDI